MKTIVLLAVIIGFGAIAGMATLANVLDVTTQKIGIFDFSIILSQNCPSGLCAIESPREPFETISSVKPTKYDDDDDDQTRHHHDNNNRTITKEDSFEGCPVSFWGSMANPEQIDFNAKHWPTGYFPNDKYSHPAYFNKLIKISLGNDPTFNEALQSEGDGINKLSRQSITALLNSAHSEINYPLSIIEIISKTQKSIQDQEYSFADELAFHNNLGKGTFCDGVG